MIAISSKKLEFSRISLGALEHGENAGPDFSRLCCQSHVLVQDGGHEGLGVEGLQIVHTLTHSDVSER
jgi:hypothetical protein